MRAPIASETPPVLAWSDSSLPQDFDPGPLNDVLGERAVGVENPLHGCGLEWRLAASIVILQFYQHRRVVQYGFAVGGRSWEPHAFGGVQAIGIQSDRFAAGAFFDIHSHSPVTAQTLLYYDLKARKQPDVSADRLPPAE
jgi:hypothetical protein